MSQTMLCATLYTCEGPPVGNSMPSCMSEIYAALRRKSLPGRAPEAMATYSRNTQIFPSAAPVSGKPPGRIHKLLENKLTRACVEHIPHAGLRTRPKLAQIWQKTCSDHAPGSMCSSNFGVRPGRLPRDRRSGEKCVSCVLCEGVSEKNADLSSRRCETQRGDLRAC